MPILKKAPAKAEPKEALKVPEIQEPAVPPVTQRFANRATGEEMLVTKQQELTALQTAATVKRMEIDAIIRMLNSTPEDR